MLPTERKKQSLWETLTEEKTLIITATKRRKIIKK